MIFAYFCNSNPQIIQDMKNFFKTALAACVGMLIFCAFSFFCFIWFIQALVLLGNQQAPVPDSAVLTLDMSTVILAEQTQELDPLTLLQGNSMNVSILGIYDAIQAINTAILDPAIQYIYMKPDMTTGGLAQVEELRKALVNFRSSGKAIVSYIENPTNAGYYLASASDKIYMTSHDGGMNMFSGMSSQMIFLKDLLERMGINVQLIRHGKYKSAGEMFVRNRSSKENLEQNEAMIDSAWDNWAREIAASRNLKTDELNRMLNDLELIFPEDFLEAGLVDGLVTREQMRQKLADLYMAEKPENVQTVSLQDYAAAKQSEANILAKNKIAVIYIDGEIMDGNAKDAGIVAGDRFAKIISDIRKDESIKAAVLRVNSPGGSVLAAEKIKAEMDLLQERVPVAASYGDYAASGGYWISAGCDRIFANGGTLTGSIGVFSLIPDFSGTVEDKLHVGMTAVKSNRHADMYGMMRPLDEKETAYMQASVEKIYDKFTSIVAEGRDMTKEQVDEIAQGRVWTGTEAMRINLVDEIGGIEDAIRWATFSVTGDYSTDNVEVVAYPKPMTGLEMILEGMGGTSEQNILADTPLEGIGKAFGNWDASESGKPYARMPYGVLVR